jgi:hypothetical protein
VGPCLLWPSSSLAELEGQVFAFPLALHSPPHHQVLLGRGGSRVGFNVPVAPWSFDCRVGYPLFYACFCSSSSSLWIAHYHPIDLAFIQISTVFFAELVLVAFGKSLVEHLSGPTTVAFVDIVHPIGA